MEIECLSCGNIFNIAPNYRGSYACICGARLYLVSNSEGKLTRYFIIDKSLLGFILEEIEC